MSLSYRRAGRLLLGILVAYALLVAPHEGEFWPFSIYPMFSRGGHPWTRALVRDVSEETVVSWAAITDAAALPGEPYPLLPTGVNQNDIANFVSKSATWNPVRTTALRRVFGNATKAHSLMVLRVDGRIHGIDTVEVVYTPFVVLAPDTTLFNPSLPLATD